MTEETLDRAVPRSTDGTLGVLICTYTAERLDQVVRAVASVDAQVRVPDEVLVVVDGTEELADLVRGSLPTALPSSGVPVRVLAVGSNQGVSVARTFGVRHLATDVVAFLDDDAEAEPGWTAALEAPLTDPAVIGSSGRSVPDWIGTRPAWLPDEFLWTVGCSYAGMPTESARIRNVYGGCAAVKRDVFLQVGGYEAELGHGIGRSGGAEEADFCVRATAATGGEFAFEPAAVIRHRVPAHRLTWSFYLERCRSEGELKARMAARVSAGSLAPEKAFATALPAATLRRLATRGRRAEALGIVLGALAVLVGMASGAVRSRLERRR